MTLKTTSFLFLIFDKFVDKFFLSICILQLLNVITGEPEATWNFEDSFHFSRGLVCGVEVWAALCCCCFGVQVKNKFSLHSCVVFTQHTFIYN